MSKILTILIIILFSLPVIWASLPTASLAAGSAIDAAKEDLAKTAETGFGDKIPFAGIGLPGIIGSLIGNILAFIGVLFLGLMIYGGILWMTARGNESQVEKAKELIRAAIVGLIIVLSAYAVTAYVGGVLTGAE